MANNAKSNAKGIFGKIIWGLLFLTAACYFVLKAIGFDADMNIFQIVIGVFLGAIVIRSIMVFEWFGVFLPIALFITIAQTPINQLLDINLNIWAIWVAAILLSIGMNIIVSKKRCFVYKNSGCTTFSSTTRRLKAEDIKTTKVEVYFGGEKIIIDDGKLDKDASINLNVSFAGVELYVPSTWQVIDNVDKSLGGITEKNLPSASKKEQVLTLTGSLSFGGIEIIYT